VTPPQLKDLCSKIGSGATPRGGKDVYQQTGHVALIRSQNVYNQKFERTGLAYLLPEHADQLQGVEVQRSDVLLNITGDSVARVCQVPNDVLPARVNQHVAIIRPRPDSVDPRFLRYYLASPQMQQHMLALASAGGTRNALTKGMIEEFILPPNRPR
jgi:type I restriction enzyme, S subunit